MSDTYGIVFNQKKEPTAGETAVASVDAFSTQYFLTNDEDQVPKGESEMYLRVIRRTGQESRSNTLNVLFKTTLPGGYDLRHWEPWHSELKLTIEGLPEGSLIDASIVDAKVFCLIEKYEHCRLNDIITIVWAGIYFTHIVSPYDIAQPGEIRIQVPANVIAKGNQFGPVFVGFTVEDVVGNEAGGKYKYSKPYALRMQLDAKKYDPPIFRVNTEEVSQVDFDTPGPLKFDVKPTLPAYKPAPNPRNMVTVKLTISLKDQPDETLSLPAVADRNQRGEPIDIPRDIVAKAVGGQLLIWVEVTNASGKVQGSGYTQVFVVGTPTTMPAPKVAPIEGTLIPSDFDISVEIPEYNPHNSAWWETLHVHQGRSGGGGLVHTQKRQAGPQGGVRDLSKVDLKQFDGKGPFSIFYSTNNGKGLPSSIRESEVLTVEIGSRIVDLPPPLIKFAEDGNIDPKNVKRSILLMSFPYMAANIGNILHWNVVGADSESSDSGIITIDAALAGPLLTEVEVGLKPEVLRNNIGGAIICSYSVESVASATEPQSFLRSELATFTVGPQVVLELPKVLEADKDFQDQLHPKNALNGATVRASIKPMLAGDIITVGWAGTFGISKTEVQVQGDPSKPYVDAHIPPEIIALAIRDTGNNITVSYRFTRGQITYKSQPLRLRLLPVTALPAPTLNKVKGMVFPLFALGDEARIDVDPWILIQKGQRMFSTAKGTFADGKPYLETIYFADKVTADEVAHGASALADVKSLTKLKDDSVLSIDFGVSYAQRDEPDTQVPFGRTEYRIQAVPATLPAPAFDNQVGPTLTIAPLAYVQGATVVVTYPA
ncbi:hypothetical protein AZH11_06865 [Pseudomonas simiae]|nr:hypothetical protein AZH11_06865 [Pseudomonas simiae]